MTRQPGRLLPVFTISLAILGCNSNPGYQPPEPPPTALTETTTGGESNYGGPEVAAQVMTDDKAFVAQLGLMRGHLLVGVQLYRRGELEQAATHMKHPEDEIYAALEPALVARNAPAMAQELTDLASAVENGMPVGRVNWAYQELVEKISAAERTVDLSSRQMGEVIYTLVTTAAEEYNIARADDGSLVNAHEYQDSLGFVEVAGDYLLQIQQRGDAPQMAATIGELLAEVKSAWPDLIPPARLDTVPAAIYSTAARIQIATLRQ